ncbi:MAG: hypothetical protein HXX09_00510 [Bacteroidetes bacterium]|nr:hypothetical protein [Bacteroidota bacterium]
MKNTIFNKTIFLKIIFFVLIISFVGCSTKKNTFTRRTYHNLTAHYNAFFNGNESLKEGVVDLEKAHVDNYNKVLPVYKYGTAQNAQSVFPAMDKAITKASKVISKHSIFIKGKENVKWIDDAYLLLGKANFYKQEYKLASETFDFVVKRYKDDPIKYDAMLWLCKTYTQTKKFGSSESLLDMIQSKMEKGDFNKITKKEFPLVYADFYIQQGNYAPAIEYLLSGIDLNKKKQVKIRLTFILAQIYQRSGNLDKATQYFKKVISMNPPYEMAFSSKINIAKCYDANAGDSKEIKKQLNKMIKDIKNKEYLDQIYFALAEIYLKETDTITGIKLLKLSASNSIANPEQKAMSYLKLADIHFIQVDYEPSEMYYDSTVAFLPKDYPTYDEIVAKKTILNNLVKNLKIVSLEDSLQTLAKMSERERNSVIDKVIERILEEERKKQQEEIDRQQSLAFLQQNNQTNTNANNSGGQWYFYNTSAVSFGFTEFVKKWGNRKLEDNWRLLNKQVSMDFSDENSTEGDSLASDSIKKNPKPNLKDRAYYLKNVPLTAEAVDKSNARISEALYNIGFIYREDLRNNPKSILTFENHLTRFPENKLDLSIYYQLYRIYQEEENKPKEDYYKGLILSKFPDSEYAKIILDPNYNKQVASKSNEVASLYNETYIAYQNRQYDVVIANSDKAISTYKDKKLNPKFDFLKALAIGKSTKDTVSLVTALKLVIAKYPNSDVKEPAQDILDALSNKNSTTKTNVNNNLNPEKKDSLNNNNKKIIPVAEYAYNPDAFHFYVLIVDVKTSNINDLKIKFSNYNTKFYSLDKLSTSNVFLDDKRQIFTVSKFENQQKGTIYYNALKNNKDIFSGLSPGTFQYLLISAENYPIFYKSKDISKYLSFYSKNYKN